MKTHQFYDSPTALFCECDTLAQSKTISGRPSGIAAEFCGGPFRPHWPHFYENVLILPQSHDPVLRIRRAGAVKTTIVDVKGQTTIRRKRPFRSHRPSLYEQRHTHMRLRSRNAHRRTKKIARADARGPIFQTPMMRNVDFWVGVDGMCMGPVGRGNVP